jgi:3-hydroxyisobutyrate dehydrogenase-like beta-hydroxyacid dehydrogenase
VLEGAQPDTLVLLHSTILPQTTRQVAEACEARGVRVIDACMVSVPEGVRAGKLSFLVGGPVDLLERARPHLDKMARQVIHMGPLGAGNAAKLFKNLCTGAETLVIYDAIRIGAAAGIAPRDALEMMRRVYTGPSIERWERTFDVTRDDPAPGALNNVFEKDVPLAAQLARQYGLKLPVTQALAAEAARLVEAQSSQLASGGA